MMDQKVEEEKERRRRRNQRIIMATIFGSALLYFILTGILPPLSREMQLNGKVLMFIPNRTSALVVLPNKVFPVFDDWLLLDKNVNIGDLIRKESGSDSLHIYRNGEESRIKLEYQDSK